MGNVNEILRRKSLLRSGMSEPVDYGEPIFHPSMWKVTFKCITKNTSLDPLYSFITLFRKAKYDTIILDDVVVMENGVLKDAYKSVIKFFRIRYGSFVEVANNDNYESAGDKWYQQRIVFNLDNTTTHTMYFTLQNQGSYWHEGGYFVWHVASNPARGMVKSIRTPAEEFLNEDDEGYTIFGPCMNAFGEKILLESLLSTPLKADSITDVFDRARVPVNSTSTYANAGYGSLAIEEFKFALIPEQ